MYRAVVWSTIVASCSISASSLLCGGLGGGVGEFGGVLALCRVVGACGLMPGIAILCWRAASWLCQKKGSGGGLALLDSGGESLNGVIFVSGPGTGLAGKRWV